ncbi:DUF4942 domain-containing protein [Acidovorax sp. LjRoot129]|uniref:DUF4942 domain-containing protein n=1 Tax=unclassified Acidovorax TaxID=2684926 RepID=UPI003ECD3C25
MDIQFYPTPQHLAKKLWSKFVTPVQCVLEPHAGEGHMITAYEEYFPEVPDNDADEDLSELRRHMRSAKDRYGSRSYRRTVKWHACEINAQKHPLLQELGAQVVGHDFLQMQSAVVYSHIVANPPFADGARHLLHAWKILYAGEIGCILNAETLRNPYTVERQYLAKLIEMHGSVEYLADQFMGEGVERETPVEIALVYLRKEAEHAVNMESILDGLKPDEYKAANEPDTHLLSALALPMNFVDRVVMDYEIAVKAARQYSESNAVFEAAKQRLGRTFEEMQSKGLDGLAREPAPSVESLIRQGYEEHLVAMRERAWAQVLRSTQLLNKLSSSAQRNVEAQFKTISKLEFSKVNIHGFFAGLMESMDSINADMVLGLFDMIMQRDSDNCTFYRSWKSNEKHKGMAMRIKRTRFILPLMQHEYTRTRLSYSAGQVLGDIDKVFRLLHGRPTEAGDGLRECLSVDANMVEASHGKRLETEFFGLRYYPGKGTIHFFPKSQEVVERLNRYVGKMRQWLPPEMDQANDDFQRQYEEAEKHTEAYLKEYRKSSSYASHPVYLLNVNRRDDETASDAEKMTRALTLVQDDLGIKPFDSIQDQSAPQAQLALCM